MAAGTSHDLVAVISGKGQKLWSVDMGGTVFSVTNLGDLDGNGADDVGAGTEMGFASAYQGFGTTVTRLRAVRAAPGTDAFRRVRLGRRSGVTLGVHDLRGRALPAPGALTAPLSHPSPLPEGSSR